MRSRVCRRWRVGLLALAVVTGPVIAGCRSDPIAKRAEDCQKVQGALQKVQADLRAILQDPRSLSDPSRLSGGLRRSATDLHATARQVADEKLRAAVDAQADQMDQLAAHPDNPAAILTSVSGVGQAITTQCTRAPGQ